MKKYNLFKILGVMILAYVVLSWLLPFGMYIFGAKDLPANEVGIISLFSVLVEAFSGFGSTFLYILAVGGFYAVLDATGVYKKALNLIVKKLQGKEKLFLIATIVILTIISSICGLELGLFIIFPFIISVILLMGYDNLTALSATVGSTLIGIYGSTFAGTTYGINVQILQGKLVDNILAKVILLVLGLGLLIFFVMNHIKKNNIKPEMPKEVEKIVKEKSKRVWPLYLVIGLVFLIFILGTTSWAGIFGFNWFETAHKAWTEFKINNFDFVNKLFGGVEALGTWNTPYRMQYYSILVLMATIIVSIIYKVKAGDALNAFFKGVKEYLVPAVLVVVCSSVFIMVYYYPILGTVNEWILSLSKDFNVATASVFTMLSSAFYVDYYYYAYYAMSTLLNTTTDTTLYPLISVLFTNLYGLVMLIAPTSMVLVATLAITEVSYKEWFKYIWKLFVSLLIVSLIVFVIMMLI